MHDALPKTPVYRSVLFAAAALLGALPAHAAVLSASASLSGSQVMTGESFQLTVQVSADKKENLPWPEVQGLEPFQVSKSTSTTSGSQTTIVNGHVSQNEYYVTNFVYALTATKPGSYALGPIHYTYKDFSQDLGSATVNVAKSEAGLTTQATLNRNKAYVGEQVLYTLRIIPKAGVQSINLPEDLQKLIGEKFYFERLEKNVTPKTVTIGGQPEQVFDIHIALFPLLSGPASLDGIPVEYQQVRRAPRRQTGSLFDMFDDDFFGAARIVNQKAMAEPLKMEVLPLPDGAPTGFTGSVGTYSLTAAVDKTSAAAGDAITLTVTIRGNGQPKSITKPVLPDLSAFEVYDPEENTTTTLEGNTLWTVKTFKYVLIPHRQGTYNLQDIEFPYFDPHRGVYARATGSPITLQIAPGKESEMPLARAMTQREIAELGSDIRHIKTDDATLEDQGDLPYHHLWFPGLFLLPPLAFAGTLVLRRRSERLRTDAALQRRSRADAQLRRRLKTAQQALSSGEARSFYHALSEAAMEFASDCTNVEFRGITLEEAKSALAGRGVKPETIQGYEALLLRCDFGQFGGLSGSEEERKKDLAQAQSLLEKLSKELG